MTTTCSTCDKGLHDKCDGTAVYIDQDGPNHYVCQCYCRWKQNRAREKKIQVAEIRRAMARRGITLADLQEQP